MTTPAQYRQDEDLGLMRLCVKCDELWPFDSEFWWYPGTPSKSYCKACHRRQGRASAAQVRATRRRAIHGPSVCSTCLAVRSQNRQCHGCSDRTRGPLTRSLLVAWGLAA